ncbi:vacuolar iron transporter 1 [Hibiscus syriacus]|uniref:Vacuolar iron transporter 1 n=1 Tax=Hibiscus syriacus TaxID=106335 RepID=A0A6A3B478_HIBSY|nr:uncharacterized protein LOC120118099 [Hibiscus syriacus]KAE8710115.1 vacuolar iron transporter 1 [Hibiscus syriacus]
MIHGYYTTSSISDTSINGTSLGWDLQNRGVLNADMSLDFSSGYLEDALLEFTERSKRRRLLLYNDDHDEISGFNDLAMQGNWNYSCNWGLSEDFTCINGVSEMKTPVETISDNPEEAFDSSSSSCKLSAAKTKSFSSGKEDKTKKKRVITRVVYPFALVKPGGIEGDTTLNDINERILMPPTRPVRHPVGDFACRPCVSADGPGLSGKAVVALTKIHTQGRGTITIIRTKG